LCHRPYVQSLWILLRMYEIIFQNNHHFSIPWPIDSANTVLVSVIEIREIICDIIYALRLNSFQLPDYVITGMMMNKLLFGPRGSLTYRTASSEALIWTWDIFSNFLYCLVLEFANLQNFQWNDRPSERPQHRSESEVKCHQVQNIQYSAHRRNEIINPLINDTVFQIYGLSKMIIIFSSHSRINCCTFP
jgi:hypothetical protein